MTGTVPGGSDGLRPGHVIWEVWPCGGLWVQRGPRLRGRGMVAQDLVLTNVFLSEEVRKTALSFRVLKVLKITSHHLKNTVSRVFISLQVGCLVWSREPLGQVPWVPGCGLWWRLAPELPFIAFLLFLVSLPHSPVGFLGSPPT